jgi:predicted Zn-dependent peptidase
MENIVKTFPCGLRMIVRPMAGFKSVAASVFVCTGSRDEEKDEFGLSHFVEHMLFKGTARRTGEEIAQTLSSLGVDYNAYTSTAATCYHTRSLPANLDTCCDILADMYFNLKFADDEFHREADVIVQEIAMHDDNPRSCLYELGACTFFEGTPYGHPITGSIKNVKDFQPADIYRYIKKHYTAPKTIISFAGDITAARAEEMVKKYWLCNFKDKNKPNLRVLGEESVCPAQQFAKRRKKTEQQNVTILFPVCNNNHPDKYTLTFVNGVMSADMSSRLFLSVRDKLGLVYTISGGLHLTHLGGYYYIWFSCTPGNTPAVLKTVAAEIERLKTEGVTDEEIQKVKNIKKTERLFESESAEDINQRNAAALAEFNTIETTDQYLAKIDKVTAKNVLAAANKYLNYKNAVVAVVGSGVKVKPFEILK